MLIAVDALAERFEDYTDVKGKFGVEWWSGEKLMPRKEWRMV